MKNNNRKFLLLLAIIMIIACIVALYNPGKKEKKLEYTLCNIDNRERIVIKDKMYIGNSKKELENGYYDISIANKDDGITININKLWKEVFTDKLYDEIYVSEIVDYLDYIVRNNTGEILTSSFKLKLKGAVIDGYVKSKNNEDYKNSISTKQIKFEFYALDYELVIEVKIV